MAVLIINTGTGASNVSIKVTGGPDISAVKAYVTDNTRDLNETTAAISGGAVTASVPARSLVSFLIT